MILINIDPGPRESACVAVDTRMWPPKILEQPYAPPPLHIGNDAIVEMIEPSDHVLVEMITSYGGRSVGKDVFYTAFWAGRFCQKGRMEEPITRPQVCHALCGRQNATKSEVKRAVMDLYPPTGGGKEPRVGLMKQPGPLIAMRAGGDHCWDALALGIAWMIKQGLDNTAPKYDPSA